MRKYMSKRQRPCDFCRSRKTACRIEGSPPCRSCHLHGKECTFVEAARPRKKHLNEALAKSPSGEHELVSGSIDNITAQPVMMGPISGLPVDNVVSFTEAGVTSTAFPEMTMQFLDELDMDGSEYQFMFRTPHSSGSNVSAAGDFPAASQSPPTHPPSDISNILLDKPEKQNPEVLGLTGDMDPYLLRSYRTDGRDIFKFKQLAIHSVHQEPIPIQFLISQPSLFARGREEADHDVVPDDELRSNLEKEVSASMGKRLIALYQKFIAIHYPIFSTQLLPDPTSSAPHLLAAIYAITFPFAMYDDQLYIDLAYDSPPYEPLSRIINTALASDLHSSNIVLVQTLLLVVGRPSSNPLVSDASYRWSVMGMLVAAAINIGLHLDPSGWNISSSQISQRRRLSFSIYATDKWLAASLGRPPYINDANWLVSALRTSDDQYSGLSPEQWKDMLDFSSLTSVLNSTLSSLYSLRSVQALVDNPQEGVDVANKLMHALISNHRAPEHDFQQAQNKLSSMTRTILTLGYHQTVLLILRSVIRPYLSTTFEVLNSLSLESRETTRLRMKECLVEFLNFIRSLRTDDVNGFWPPWCQSAFSSICFTELLMTISSSTFDETTMWIEILQETRLQLRFKSSSLPVLRLGLLRIDAIFWRGVNKVLKLEPHVLDAFKASSDP
ncbi:fungal-specific transcription factor domain-containing protein [Dactylonectria macrodidyma]|uniref:Fungal-specific transcription factor domain-containing protein n=1 Tax=Dactylonectria macrodidyma TaxID=307937 RepID=A0A9P9FK40_9HYPO|nr:fungal-specific transcription factor domain-containing protein [Dactylonectria macrodidyma]